MFRQLVLGRGLAVNCDLWVLEWHQPSNNFHIQALDRLLSRNRDAYRDDRCLQNWIVLHVGTKDECHKAAEAARPTLRKRERERIGA